MSEFLRALTLEHLIVGAVALWILTKLRIPQRLFSAISPTQSATQSTTDIQSLLSSIPLETLLTHVIARHEEMSARAASQARITDLLSKLSTPTPAAPTAPK